MNYINIFESKIDINIMIYSGSHIIISYKGKILFEGMRKYCMDKIRQMIDELSSIGEKEIIFHIQNMTTGSPIYEQDKLFFKNHLSMLNTSTKCKIEVKTGLYNVFA